MFRPVQSNLKYFWLLQEDWKMTILFQGSLFWTKIRPCKWSKQRKTVRTITSGSQNNNSMVVFSWQEAQYRTTRPPLTRPSSLGHPEWEKVHTKEDQILRDREAKGHPDMERVDQCWDRQDLPTPMVGLSPLYGSKMCLTAVIDS